MRTDPPDPAAIQSLFRPREGAIRLHPRSAHSPHALPESTSDTPVSAVQRLPGIPFLRGRSASPRPAGPPPASPLALLAPQRKFRKESIPAQTQLESACQSSTFLQRISRASVTRPCVPTNEPAETLSVFLWHSRKRCCLELSYTGSIHTRFCF